MPAAPSSEKNKIILSVIVPCYNEEQSLLSLYSKISFCLDTCRKLQFIFLENGSIDSSRIIFEELRLQSSHPNLQFVSLADNKGYGYGIKSCIPHARGSFIGWTHGDNQTDILDIIRFYNILENLSDRTGVVPLLALKGVRYARSIADSAVSSAMTILASIIYFPFFMSEINAQPSIYSSNLFRSIESFPDDYNIDAFCWIYARIHKYRIIRLPVLFPPREYGQSSWNVSFSSKVRFMYRQFVFLLSYRFSCPFLLGR
jgi:glycosyltransferase involved in cell wall biosynthesis